MYCSFHGLKFYDYTNGRKYCSAFCSYYFQVVNLILIWITRILYDRISVCIFILIKIGRAICLEVESILNVKIQVQSPAVEIPFLINPDIELVKTFYPQAVELRVIQVATSPYIPGRTLFAVRNVPWCIRSSSGKTILESGLPVSFEFTACG